MVQRLFTVLFEDNLAIVQGQLVASHLITLSPHFLGWQTMMNDDEYGIHIGCCQGECNRCNRTTFRANMQTSQPQFLHCIFCNRVFVDILCLAEHKDDIMGLKDWVWLPGPSNQKHCQPEPQQTCSKTSSLRPRRGLHLGKFDAAHCQWDVWLRKMKRFHAGWEYTVQLCTSHPVQRMSQLCQGAATGLWDKGRWYVLKGVAVMARAACCFDGTFHVKCIKVSYHDLLHLVWWVVIEAKVDSSY